MNRAAAMVLLCGLAGCGGASREWIDGARSANERADALAAAGDFAGAAHVLEGLVARRPPAAVAAADARVVLQEAYRRLSGLSLRGGRADEALRQADAGLELGDMRDLFASGLRTARGRALEASGRDGEAVREYEAAQQILEALLQAARDDGGTR